VQLSIARYMLQTCLLHQSLLQQVIVVALHHIWFECEQQTAVAGNCINLP
jgi:hypothetical protein